MYSEFNKHLPAIKSALKSMGYRLRPGKGGIAVEEIDGQEMSTYWQVFITPKKAKQILGELYERKPTREEVSAYMKGAQPYLDFLLVWKMPEGGIQYVGDYYGNKPYHPKDIFPLKKYSLLGTSIPIPRRPVHYLKNAYKTDKSPVTNAVIWSEHKAGLKPICNQRLKAALLHGDILKDMNAYLKRIFGPHLKVTTKKSLKKYD